MAPVDDDDDDSTTMAADEASSGPSSGPAEVRRLRGSNWYADDVSISDIDDASDRQLEGHLEDDDSSDNATTTAASETMSATTTAPTETSEAEMCDCPAPQVVTTFGATLTLGSAADLADLDLAAMATQLTSDAGWGDSVEVTTTHVVKIGVQYTLDVDITEAQCKAAVAAAYTVSADDVECGDASAASAPAASAPAAPAPAAPAPAAPAPAPAPAGDRRLTSVKDVTISFDTADLATAAATASQDAATTTAFTSALADEDVVAVVEVSETVSVSVVVTFTVTADSAITEPTPAELAAAVTAITVTAEITSPVALTYDRMPCSASDICAGGGMNLVADAASVGCDGATCTTEERDRCCVRAVGDGGNAQGRCVLGSLSALLLWHSF
jgi:hypothetical protein